MIKSKRTWISQVLSIILTTNYIIKFQLVSILSISYKYTTKLLLENVGVFTLSCSWIISNYHDSEYHHDNHSALIWIRTSKQVVKFMVSIMAVLPSTKCYHFEYCFVDFIEIWEASSVCMCLDVFKRSKLSCVCSIRVFHNFWSLNIYIYIYIYSIYCNSHLRTYCVYS